MYKVTKLSYLLKGTACSQPHHNSTLHLPHSNLTIYNWIRLDHILLGVHWNSILPSTAEPENTGNCVYVYNEILKVYGSLLCTLILPGWSKEIIISADVFFYASILWSSDWFILRDSMVLWIPILASDPESFFGCFITVPKNTWESLKRLFRIHQSSPRIRGSIQYQRFEKYPVYTLHHPTIFVTHDTCDIAPPRLVLGRVITLSSDIRSSRKLRLSPSFSCLIFRFTKTKITPGNSILVVYNKLDRTIGQLPVSLSHQCFHRISYSQWLNLFPFHLLFSF